MFGGGWISQCKKISYLIINIYIVIAEDHGILINIYMSLLYYKYKCMGFGTRNVEGERILEFCDAVGLVVCNTFFKKE